MKDREILDIWENTICSISEMSKGKVRLDFTDILIFARAIEKPTPQFDVESDEQEDLAIKFCNEINGRIQWVGHGVDPARLLEMAEELYKAKIRYRENK